MYSNIAETSQKPRMELSAKTVNSFNPLTIFAKSPIPGVESKYFSHKINLNEKSMAKSAWTVCTVPFLYFVFKYQKRCRCLNFLWDQIPPLWAAIRDCF